MSIWKEDRIAKEMAKVTQAVNDFFVGLKNFTLIGVRNVTYRDKQHNLSLDIMKAIRNNEILLMQAGVGIGKTFGYLIPIFNAINGVQEFNKVIISTSSIALQEQLLEDIKKVSEMLGIDIKYGLAKGINNYACLKKVEEVIYGFRTTEETKQILNEVRREMTKLRSSDKSDLMKVSEEIWEEIKLRNRGACSNCTYSTRCPYYRRQDMLDSANIIVTNHANMVYNLTHNTSLVEDVDLVVYDEAHKLAENIRGIFEKELSLDDIKDVVGAINVMLSCSYQKGRVNYSFREQATSSRNNDVLFSNLDKLFSRIMSSSSKNFFETQKKIGNEGDYSVTDGGRIGFWITPTVRKQLDIVILEFEKLISEIRMYQNSTQVRIDDKLYEKLLKIYKVFCDMRKDNESENIYWANYYKKNRITIKYTPKDVSKITNDMFYDNIPNVLLSGTMDYANGYAIPNNELGLNTLMNRTIRRASEYTSPYNYEENSLFYYDKTMPKPSKSDEYIKRLALEVGELIRASNGKSLVLFTSKATMNKVYEILQSETFPFRLLLQTDNNTALVKEEFTNDVNSCLFATGAFWEGIDIKGPSLSNVIITQLPFEVYDAVNQHLSKNYVDKDSTIHIPKMVMKLTQGVGRLIRSDTDTGIVCCLDSRVTSYLEEIKKSIHFPMTSDKEELYKFLDDKVLEETDSRSKN